MTPADRIRNLLASFDLDPVHPPACEAEAAAWLAAPGIDDASLVDLEHLPFVTIDNDDSRDLDQALFIARDGDGFVVWYALADAAYYVRPGSALFTESLARGASYYLPGLTVPMLPRALSEGLVSLNEAVPRRAFVFRVALDARGEVGAVSLERARMRSRRKLSYRGVQAYWDGDPAAEALGGQDFSASLDALREVGRLRIALAEANNVVRYQRVEVDVGLSATGFVAFEARRYETDRANEQISLLVNVEGARLLAAHVRATPTTDDDDGLQAVFRVHPAPLPQDLSALARLTRAIAAREGERALAWEPGRESLARWLERICALASHREVVVALQRQALLLNQRSTFAPEPGLHYGVGASCYARFTSPMREVVGIFTHKEALELLGLAPPVHDPELREVIIASANRAKDLQHQLTKAANQLVIADMLDGDLAARPDARPHRPATIVGFAPDKAYVLLDDPPLELKVYARDLGARPQLVDDGATLTLQRPEQAGGGELRLMLGARVALVTAGYDRARDRYVLLPVALA